MDQVVVSGIGNVYCVELLFWVWQNFFILGKEVFEEVVCGFWCDWVMLFNIGVDIGQMLMMDGFLFEDQCKVFVLCVDWYWVYYCIGELCCVCGIEIVM